MSISSSTTRHGTGSSTAATTSSTERGRWARLVQEKIKQPLAEELLFGKLVNGGEVKVHIKDHAPAFEIAPAAPKAKPKKRKAPAKKKAGGEAPPAE